MLRGHSSKRASTASEQEKPTSKRPRRTKPRDADQEPGPVNEDDSMPQTERAMEDREPQAVTVREPIATGSDGPFVHSKAGPVNTEGPFHFTDKDVQRYREWQKSGGEHDQECLRCGKYVSDDDRADCYTCRRTFHPSCLDPPVSPSAFREDSTWWCRTCIRRGWHVHPPTPMSPPMTPRPDEAPSTAVSTATVADSKMPPPPQPSHLRAPVTAGPIIHPDNVFVPPLSSSSPSSVSRAQSLTVDPSIHTHHQGPHPLSQSSSAASSTSTRRSRFSTLSPSLETALQTLYIELEASADLRAEIANLHTRILGLAQELKIRDNRLILSSRALEASEADLAGARTELAERDRERERGRTTDMERNRVREEGVMIEVEGLRKENAVLRAEVEGLRRQVLEKDGVVEEWKRKLRGLME